MALRLGRARRVQGFLRLRLWVSWGRVGRLRPISFVLQNSITPLPRSFPPRQPSLRPTNDKRIVDEPVGSLRPQPWPKPEFRLPMFLAYVTRLRLGSVLRTLTPTVPDSPTGKTEVSKPFVFNFNTGFRRVRSQSHLNSTSKWLRDVQAHS